MGFRRRDVLVAVASLLIVTSCGDNGSPAATTNLPLQEDALAVSADVRERAKGVIKARLSEDQLQQVTEACSKPKIADQKARCVELLKSIAESDAAPCGPRDLCMTLYDTSDLDSTVDAYMEITDPRPDSVCESGPANVCLRTGFETSGLLDDIVPPGSTTSLDGATTTTSTAPETTRTTPSVTTSSSTSSSTSVPEPTTGPAPTSATTAPP